MTSDFTRVYNARGVRKAAGITDRRSPAVDAAAVAMWAADARAGGLDPDATTAVVDWTTSVLNAGVELINVTGRVDRG